MNGHQIFLTKNRNLQTKRYPVMNGIFTETWSEEKEPNIYRQKEIFLKVQMKNK